MEPRSAVVRRGPAREGGQALVEFALVAPLFFLLVFAVIQFGLLMASQNGLVDGVREAARRAATYRINEGSFDATVFPGICSNIRAELEERLADRVVGWNPGALTSTINYEWEQNPESDEWFLVAHVHAAFKNPLYVPLVSVFLDNSDGSADDALTLTADERMRVENPALTKSDPSDPDLVEECQP
jgi:hypothetical protein